MNEDRKPGKASVPAKPGAALTERSSVGPARPTLDQGRAEHARGGRTSLASPAERPSRITCNGLVELVTLDHYLIRVDRRCRLLFARRTTVPFDDTRQIRVCFRDIEQALAPIPRRNYCLLVDARHGPSRNDPGFESVLQEERGKLLFGFAKSAALAATAAGRLQIQRYAKHDGRQVLTTDDPAAAFDYLGLSPHPV